MPGETWAISRGIPGFGRAFADRMITERNLIGRRSAVQMLLFLPRPIESRFIRTNQNRRTRNEARPISISHKSEPLLVILNQAA